ncbi:ABC transporter permease [Clostridium grantii]|uniref:Spermidine/putrescine transport system permease protein n=1 Tax=Clostridium grantii DSM 8605 TaxID=1121316 RepID=A0A1M5WME9_9CLOT|nr:ABC transporter permease [Clostridium grantii]SHH88364.1 spermidine/putrescine transport system permease protein [Clostridium grantii DSM 8605]
MKKSIAYPYIFWSIIFIVFPLLLVLYFSLSVGNGFFSFSLENYKRAIEPIYLKVIGRSISLAFISTLICLILGYPVAMILANVQAKRRNTLILLFIVPMWMNFLLRTYAWMWILGKNGLINSILNFFGFSSLSLLYNNSAVILGMVYNFLPFMVLPIYTVLTKMDKNLLEAAQDLGANKAKVFLKIIFPMSIPGVLSGITMVFMPAVSTFVISRLLGGGQYMLIGNLIEQQFLVVGDWRFGSALSIFMMIIILLSMALMNKVDEKESEVTIW